MAWGPSRLRDRIQDPGTPRLMADRRCTAKARTGKRCGNRPIRGSTVCRMHGGSAPQVRQAARRRVATVEAQAELERLGIPIDDADPLEVLLGQVREAAGNVAFLRDRVADLHQGYTAWPNVDAEDSKKVDLTAGIAGPNHLGDGARHIFVVMYDEERDRLARMAKLCIEAGVAERRVQLAERQGELLAEAMKRIFADLKLTKGQRAKVPATVRRHLSAVADVESA